VRADAAVARQGQRVAGGAPARTVPQRARLATGGSCATPDRRSLRAALAKIGGQHAPGALRAPLIDSEETPHRAECAPGRDWSDEYARPVTWPSRRSPVRLDGLSTLDG